MIPRDITIFVPFSDELGTLFFASVRSTDIRNRCVNAIVAPSLPDAHASQCRSLLKGAEVSQYGREGGRKFRD